MVIVDFSREKKEEVQSLAGFCKSIRKKHLKFNYDIDDHEITRFVFWQKIQAWFARTYYSVFVIILEHSPNGINNLEIKWFILKLGTN
jgi:hypothetical protein